ncbi:DMT family transporter [Marinospirillum sp.]|uniref:DMT family transporter n=1 Tax=Marinospirillum sp. TaxID=2183934 RepID=UPI0028700185|nr:DMT family transporter [Marinospirillum sp.]
MEKTSQQTIGLIAGVLTITLWALLPVLRNMVQLPPMLTAAVAMASAALLSQLIGRWKREPASAWPFQNPKFWVMGAGALTGALYFYFLALGEGDPAKVTLVTYTWPLGFVLVADRLAGKGLQIRTLMGGLVAFSGLAPLVLSTSDGAATPPLAYASGLAAGGCWILFSLYLRNNSAGGMHDYKQVFLSVSVMALLLHAVFESSPKQAAVSDWVIAMLIGIGPYGLAFIAWGFALGRSSSSLLGVLTYFVPVISAAFLVLIGWASLSVHLLVASLATLVSAFITNKPGSTSRQAHQTS